MKIGAFEILKRSAMAAMAAGPIGASAANLLVNGGFESPIPSPLTSGYAFADGAGIPGWFSSSARGIVVFNGIYRPPGEGAQAIQLESPGDSISQTLSTTPGAAYRLTFLLSSFDALNGTLTVWGPGFQWPATGTPNAYVAHSVEFAAIADRTTITFVNSAPSGSYNYPHLDGVAVSAIPEPSAAWLAACGLLAGYGYWAARSKRVGTRSKCARLA